MKKFTCVIPTLWLSKEFVYICEELQENKLVQEIIVIDNNRQARNIDFSKYGKPIHYTLNIFNKTYKVAKYGKYLVIDAGENLFVSKPWNMGATLASNPLLCILNDDILVNAATFNFISKNITKDTGIIGVDYNNYSYTGHNPVLIPISFRPYAFGCCMFIHKSKYVKIPDDIKVFYNDDFLLHKIQGNKFVISNVEMRGSVSTSINDPYIQSVTESIKAQDKEAFEKIIIP